MKLNQFLVLVCLFLSFTLTVAIIVVRQTPRTAIHQPILTTPTTTASDSIEPSSLANEDEVGVAETLDATAPFGFVVGVSTSTGQPHLILDVAQWFDGDAADAAMMEDGVCEVSGTSEPLSCAPSGFYIRNNRPATINIPLASDMQFRETELYAQTLPKRVFDQSDLDYFIESITDPKTRQMHGVMPVRLKLLRGHVIEVQEVYVP